MWIIVNGSEVIAVVGYGWGTLFAIHSRTHTHTHTHTNTHTYLHSISVAYPVSALSVLNFSRPSCPWLISPPHLSLTPHHPTERAATVTLKRITCSFVKIVPKLRANEIRQQQRTTCEIPGKFQRHREVLNAARRERKCKYGVLSVFKKKKIYIYLGVSTSYSTNGVKTEVLSYGCVGRCGVWYNYYNLFY